MKKTARAVVADEPMGIVIAWGIVAESAPKVKAYLWCSPESSALGLTED
ncbi:MAG: hypothetical protein ABIR92_08285 [Gemmatimonadaceae bacterium]